MPYEKIGKNEPVCIADEVPFEIPESWEWCRVGDLFSNMTGLSQFPMTLTDSGSGHKVTVDADDSFDHAVLWQQDAESFVCMEPWNGWANSVNEEGKHEVLEPDEAMTADWSITIEKI